jgi:predicted lipase
MLFCFEPETAHLTIGAMQVYLTGHSLGGALATLAAFDVTKALKHCGRPTSVACYAFGSPRTGNHEFAREYTATVPDTWNIINDQVNAQCMLIATA